MRILITGGTGLIGTALCRHWLGRNHEIHVWSRHPEKVPVLCGKGVLGVATLAELDDIPLDAVVNLAGAPIADHRWTSARCAILERSRIDLTRELVSWMSRRAVLPRVLVSGSAVGIYGDRGEDAIDEDADVIPADFGSRLCLAWEAEALRAQALGIRVVCVRTAPVLAPSGGMLERLTPMYRWGLGGALGSGHQWFPWIHLADEVRLIDFLLHHPTAQGPFNATAPTPIRQAQFARAMGTALGRPARLRVPAWLLRMMLGEMSVLLLGGQCALPEKALAAGFSFLFPQIDAALADVLRQPQAQD